MILVAPSLLCNGGGELIGTLVATELAAGATEYAALMEEEVSVMDAPVPLSEESNDPSTLCVVRADVESVFFTDAEGVVFTRVDEGEGLGEAGEGQE